MPSWIARSVRILIVCAGIALSMSASAAAQSLCPAPCTINAGQTFTVQVDHDGVNTTGYRVYLDGAKLGTDLSMNAFTAGVVTVSGLIAPAAGSHTLELAAFGPGGETKSATYSFTTKVPAPTAPKNTRILITALVAEDGSITFKVTGIE